jgi:hypothetical protein
VFCPSAISIQHIMSADCDHALSGDRPSVSDAWKVYPDNTSLPIFTLERGDLPAPVQYILAATLASSHWQTTTLSLGCLSLGERANESHFWAPTMLSNPLYAPVGVTATQRSGKRKKKWKILQFSSKIQATPLNHHLTSFPHLFHPKTHPKHSSTRYYYCCSAALVVSQLLQVENSCHRPCG